MRGNEKKENNKRPTRAYKRGVIIPLQQFKHLKIYKKYFNFNFYFNLILN